MKHIIILLVLLSGIFLTEAQNPSKTVLYTCGTNEEFFCYEYYSNMKVVGNKFACITKNKLTSKLSLILNSVTVVSAKQLDVFWIDLTSKSKCIYAYSNADNEDYLYIEGQTYGPYEQIKYWKQACNYYWDGTPNLDLMYNKNSFVFKRMGKIFRHDNDGSIYECKGESVWNASEDTPTYHSKSGLHKAQFSMNYRLLNLDGSSYVMPIDVDTDEKSINLRDFVITDDGTCIVEFGFNNGDGWSYPYFIVSNNSIEYINDGEYYDPVSKTIKAKGTNLPARQPRQMESIMRWKDGSWINGIDISLQDKSNRHFFTANWNYNYVMVDDKKIGNSTPINAFYDAANNAFGWVTIEGKQLVLYTYKL